jgi:hypothetical protein
MSNLPMTVYLDDREVDALWMALKRDGIPTERVKKAQAHVSAKAKFGLGKFLSSLVADLESEIATGASAESSVKVAYASPLRLLLLLELIHDIKRCSLEERSEIQALRTANFVDLTCPGMSFAPVPRLGSYLFQHLLRIFRDDTDDDIKRSDLIGMLEKITTEHGSSFSFAMLTDEDNLADERFHKLATKYSDEMFRVLQTSEDTWALGISHANDALLMSVFEQEKLKSNVAALIGDEHVRLFGRVVANKTRNSHFLSVAPIALMIAG